MVSNFTEVLLYMYGDVKIRFLRFYSALLCSLCSFFYLNKITEIWYVCKISSSRYGKALKAKITTNSNKTVEKLNTIGILLAVLHKFYSRALIVIIS